MVDRSVPFPLSRGGWRGGWPCPSSLLQKLQRGGVHAIAPAGRRRAVGKHVPEMAVAARAAGFRPRHPIGVIDDLADVLRIDWLEEARPARAGLEFRAGLEEWQAAEPAG